MCVLLSEKFTYLKFGGIVPTLSILLILYHCGDIRCIRNERRQTIKIVGKRRGMEGMNKKKKETKKEKTDRAGDWGPKPLRHSGVITSGSPRANGRVSLSKTEG